VKAAHSKHHWQLEFNVGNWVWLHLNQHTAVSVREGPLSKLAPKYFGPYHVIKQLDEVAYWLQLPPKARIHNVFHVAFLKKFDGVALMTIHPYLQLCASALCHCPKKWCAPSQQPTHWTCLSSGKAGHW
jgi:hypothetical protein